MQSGDGLCIYECKIYRMLTQYVEIIPHLNWLKIGRALRTLLRGIDTALVCALELVLTCLAELKAIILGLDTLASWALVRQGK